MIPIILAILVVGIVIYISINSAHKKKDKQNLKQSLVNQAHAFVDEVNKNKAFPIINSSLFLDKDEKAILEEETFLFETRAVRQTGGSGMGFRVAKGVYIGGYSGQSESHKEWRAIDQGTLTITNKKIVFNGMKENRIIPIGKILSTSNTLESIEISIEGKSKNISFPVKNSYIWRTAIFVLKSTKDPFKLDVGIDAELN